MQTTLHGKEKMLLENIPPTIPSLVDFVKTQQHIVPVYVKQINKVNGMNVVTLSTGNSYFVSGSNQWKRYENLS